ncbi:MAG: hypothetical protein BWY26_01122 [Elusimicrobia bacterium ADurb.Bin231]|nr:MAG: hypothetical protein BWY26_01122 [Elusimicrobia bacterium ADurb.Bin231]
MNIKKSLKYVFTAASIIFVVIALSQICMAERDLPQVILTKEGEKKLILPEALIKHIRKFYPDLVVPTMDDKKDNWLEFVKKDALPPFYCWGDFNGDELIDAAFILLNKMDKSIGKLIVFHKTGRKTYESFVLVNDLKHPTKYGTATQKPGKILTASGKGYGIAKNEKRGEKITLKNDSINFWLYEGASSVFHWENGKYIRTWISD